MRRIVVRTLGIMAAAGLASVLVRHLGKKVQGSRDGAASQGADLVDEAGQESFPASDPPGWTLGPDSPRS
jgi:hypothetical protein